MLIDELKIKECYNYVIFLFVLVKVLIFLFIFFGGEKWFLVKKINKNKINMKLINDNDLLFIVRNWLFGIFFKKYMSL